MLAIQPGWAASRVVRERVAHETYLCEPAQDGPSTRMVEDELRAATGQKPRR